MRKHVCRWLSLILCLVLLPISALGEYAFVQLGAQMYSEPASTSSVVSSYKAGTWLEIQDADGASESDSGYLRVMGTDGRVGYVQTKDVFVESMVNPSQMAVVANGGKYVNLRSQPDKKSSVLAKVNSGTPMILNSASKSFDQVTVGDLQGYMASGLLAVGGKPIYSAYIESSNKKDVNLRSEPSADSSVVAKMPCFSQVKVYILGGGWAKVSYQKHTGYVMSKFLTSVPSPAPNPNPDEPDDPVGFREVNSTAYVSNGGAPVRYRTGPSTSSSVAGKASSGTEVFILATNGTWDKITIGYGGGVYYMMSRYIVTVMPIDDPDGPMPGPVPNPNWDDVSVLDTVGE